VDIGERFAAPLRHLAAEGFLAIEGDTIRYTRQGLLQVDTLLHDFFLPQHRDARYA
jgi:oxygen-independent coproporphyrinogen-3 oxidase